ncbi:MAG: acyl-homoserine-lactone acylase [Chitinophagales bacterium]|jgi:acyl-homoserine-lactone acylase
MKKHLFIALLVSSFLSLQAQEFPPIDPLNINIARDEWGVPHIFGNTDAEAAYGLAWCNAEDAFAPMQEILIVGKGLMGKYQGIEGAEADYFSHVIQANQLVEEKIKTLPNDFLQYLDGYAQGINRFAELNPEGIKVKGLFPVEVKDILKSYVVIMSFLTNASGALDQIYNGKLDEIKTGLGSNAFAINSTKSADGGTYICINPHLEMVGSFSFYEAHIASNEGLNMSGSLFLGGTSVYMGNNENLAWGMTWNYFDQGDIYKLKMHPKKKRQYEYDGEWKKLETKRTILHVRVGKKISLPIPKKSYWSELGPVVKSNENKDQYYAFKFPAFLDITAPYQWYKMNKAQNFTEFKEALDILGIGMFNIVYADKEDNIYYVSYGQVPVREDSLVQLAVIPGDKSSNVWQELHTVEELPHNLNPDCGFVFNTNNTPFHSDCETDLAYKLQSPMYIDLRPSDNNRSTRLSEQLEELDKIDFDQFQAIKFDNKYSKETYLVKKLAPILTVDPSTYPNIEDALTWIQNWDFEADSNDISAALLMVSIDHLFRKKGYGDKQFVTDLKVTDEELFTAVRDAKAWFIEHYGTIEVPLGKIFKARKGELEVTSPGFPDALAANYGKRQDDKYVLEYGDTYTHFVKFDANGVVEMRTLVPFGNSYHPEDDHYFSQADLFRQQKTKEMSLDKAKIMEEAAKIYHPR